MLRRNFRLNVRAIRSLVLWTWVVVFATVSVAETTHHHARVARSEQHCSICIAAIPNCPQLSPAQRAGESYVTG